LRKDLVSKILPICFKEGTMFMLKLKRNLRWIIPLVVVVVVAAYFVLAPMVGAHAAGVAGPDVRWPGQ
jgi:hypothetical protein